MKHLFILFIFTLFFIVSCKKAKELVPTTSSPIFVFDGNIGSEKILFEAGKNNIYMFSDYYKDNQSLLSVLGYFGKDTCANCEPYLSFEFKDKDASNNTGLYSTIADFLASANGGNFNSYSLDTISTILNVDSFQFTSDINPIGTTYEWDFDDGTTSSLASPSHVYTATGIKNIRLITTLNNVKDTTINQIDVSAGSTCRAQFSRTIDTILQQLTVNSSGFTTYNWNFGDSTTDSGSNVTKTYTNAGNYKVTLTATNGNCTSVFSRKIRITGQFFTPLSSYTYTTTSLQYPTSSIRLNALSGIITWKRDGKTYYSYKSNSTKIQSANLVFKLNTFAPYENNFKGQKTIKLEGETDTWLYNKDNNSDSIQIKSNKLIFAVAYPS
jgi:PKD repeat protein